MRIRHVIAIVSCLLVFVVGISQAQSQKKDAAVPEVKEFCGVVYTRPVSLFATKESMENVPRVGFSPKHMLNPYAYQGSNANIRLVHCVRESDSKEQVFESITTTQIKVDGKWLQHGLEVSKLLDGKTELQIYNRGQAVYRTTWHSNGNLSLQEGYLNGSLYGLRVMYFDSGNPQVVTVHDVGGKELSGTVFDVKGNKVQ